MISETTVNGCQDGYMCTTVGPVLLHATRGKSGHCLVDVIMLQVEVVAESLDQVLAGQHVDLMKVVGP
jgi:hypothetical protein